MLLKLHSAFAWGKAYGLSFKALTLCLGKGYQEIGKKMGGRFVGR